MTRPFVLPSVVASFAPALLLLAAACHSTSRASPPAVVLPPPPLEVVRDPRTHDDLARPPASHDDPLEPSVARPPHWPGTPRATALLVVEIQQIEALFRETKKAAADRPKLVRRLADDYAELERAAERDERASGGDAAGVEKARRTEKAARDQAIRYYVMLHDGYANWCQRPDARDPKQGAGCGDETLLHLGHEYVEAGATDRARQTWLELVDSWPDSNLLGDAFVDLGESFFRDAESDPARWALAEQAYVSALRRLPPDRLLAGYAVYKLGFVLGHEGRGEDAVERFRAVVDFAATHPDVPGAAELGASAREMLARGGDAPPG